MLSIKQLFTPHKKPARAVLLVLALALFVSPAMAAGGPSESLFSNPLAITLIFLMVLLLIIIAVLGSILVGTADWKSKDSKKKSDSLKPLATILLMLVAGAASAQDGDVAAKAVSSIGGIAAPTFYVIISVLFLELAIIMILLMNIRFLIRAARERAQTEAAVVKAPAKAPAKIWSGFWNKINSFKPVEQEKDIELDHEYDGIKELDNRLPPWWLYGFYITIIIGVIYLWRYHVSETAPLSDEEYRISVAKAEAEVEEYLRKKGESVNENTVAFMSDAADLGNGKKIYTASCVVCHGGAGEGGVGPNLTDDYFLHGGDIKSIFKTIKYGVDGKGMAAWQSVYSPKEMAQIASYVKSLVGTNPANPKEPQGVVYKEEASAAATESSAKASADVTP